MIIQNSMADLLIFRSVDPLASLKEFQEIIRMISDRNMEIDLEAIISLVVFIFSLNYSNLPLKFLGEDTRCLRGYYAILTMSCTCWQLCPKKTFQSSP